MASWNSEYDPNRIAEKIEGSKVLDASGKVTFQGFIHEEYVTLLYSMLKFSDTLPEAESRRIVYQAPFKAGEKGQITSKTLLQEINKLEGEYFTFPINRYVLATTISLAHPFIAKVHLNKAILLFGKELPAAFKLSRNGVITRHEYTLPSKLPNNYLDVRVYVSARSVHEAADNALNALDLIRGIWNLFYNRQHSIRMSFGSQEPVNKLVLGPIHTLHNVNGALATDTFWYEPRYYKAQKVHSVTTEVEKLQKFYSNIRKKLAKSNYQQVLENAIIQYARALDERDWEIAFLKIWSILETLTDTEEGYKVTIRRASFVFEDHEYYQQLLRHLKDYRNKFVHEAAYSSQNETYMYQVKNLVEALLGFHLGNKFNFATIKEACEFLDIPTDKNLLARRIKLMRNAQKYLRYTENG